MAVIFISHASKDDAHAKSLEDWLAASGFTQIFVDHESITSGDNWRRKLQESARSCRVVICLVTDNWLQSAECLAEYNAARFMGKRIIPVMLIDAQAAHYDGEAGRRLSQVYHDARPIDLNHSMVNGRLDIDVRFETGETLRNILHAAGASEQLGLDPGAFEIDRQSRPVPFPGLSSFEDSDADAAIFYGRSREISRTLDELRKQRASADLRPLVIFGASGSGKSSLLKAGIIPRLRREAPAWLPLRAFRPRSDPLLQFSQALSRTCVDFGLEQPHGPIFDRLLGAWKNAERHSATGDLTEAGRQALEDAIEYEGRSLRAVAGLKNASIMISVDQAEELTGSGGENADALADYLRAALLSVQSSWPLAFTIRTDSFPDFQRHSRFRNLEARGYDLRAIPTYRFDDVIEQPAKRYGVEIDPQLVDQMMEDAQDHEAMPLLAFAMQRLWNEYAHTGRLTLHHYLSLRGLGGLLDDSAERALRGLAPGDDASKAWPGPKMIADAQQTFVPAMVDINQAGSAVRRVVPWSEFSTGQHRILERFEDWYLVTTAHGESVGKTIEVAHDALFDKWERLREWLEPERARLEAVRLLKAASFSWDRHHRSEDYLEHRRARRLQEAQALAGNPRYGSRLGGVDRAYLEACEQAAAEQTKQRRRRRAIATLLTLFVALGALGWIEQNWVSRQWKLYTNVRPFMKNKVLPFVLAAQAEAALQPGETFRECADDVPCPRMVVIRAGSFMMGSQDGRANEKPVHGVTIAKPFAVGKFEVTFDEWDTCVAHGWCQINPDNFGRGKQPAINVSWRDADTYVKWLSEVTGKRYRLLSESEWEYSARAGHPTTFPWGDDPGAGNANCRSCGNEFDNKKTVEVGWFRANNFGLYDMNGNVWEWCADVAELSYEGAPVDGSPRTGGPRARRILRGGAWNSAATNLRPSARYAAAPVGRHEDYGFRVARSLSKP